jgi:hypothetical protein
MTRRLLTHILIAVLSWALFGYYWGLVARRRITPNTIQAVQILLVLVLLIWTITALWIQHNRRRFAGRPDRRTHRTTADTLPLVDSLGRSVLVADESSLTDADYVEITIDAETGQKVFRSTAIPTSGRVR